MTARRCPRCGSDLLRIRRRFVDRVISLVWTVHRYRCNNFHCQWEGDLRQTRDRQEH